MHDEAPETVQYKNLFLSLRIFSKTNTMKKMLLLTILCALVVGTFLLMSGKKPAFKTVETAEFAQLLASDAAVQLVDVRTPMEYSEGHLPGAVLIDVKDSSFLSKAKAQFSAERPVAVYCRSGRRSAMAAAMLAGAGFEVVNLKGGIMAWQADERPTTKDECPNPPSAQHSTEDVERRVREIYDEIFGWYIAHADEPCANDFDNETYFSKDYWQTLYSVIRLDTDNDGTFFFDYDHWVQGQDWDKDLALSIDSVEKKDDSHALVHARITNCGTTVPLDLAMALESDRWVIDDFISPQNGHRSEKADMKEYIKTKENN